MPRSWPTLLLAGAVGAFQLPAAHLGVSSRASVSMGFGDMFKKAFTNNDYSTSPATYEQTNARALHILVADESQANSIKVELSSGLDFMEAAMKCAEPTMRRLPPAAKLAAAASYRYSTCDSAARGGDLGKFTPGQMVRRACRPHPSSWSSVEFSGTHPVAQVKEFDDVVFGVEDTGKINLKNDAYVYASKCASLAQMRRSG